ncbi:endoribonuclease L-PSP [Desulfonatronospira thiodismutans ASO3-1]|uniref:Endoribonuclease L-PSP n=1 Tax=Desulfonatronospira thiodismutans ASO3-1 TaxID=555779 RepID=D6SP29_9BACT|nr:MULTISPECIES: RidA family protein [Desulfonatronospira]EFI34505.1 endoribonuclease L-PSP [Desulfonatronospira thiodismutans ASO3-1]RQD73368.1 MAG: RidA family protein [Desulfonatronospira sp. MSAO_Bac3]
MSKTVIHTSKAPQAVGPYSQAVALGSLLFTSGQLPLDPETGDMLQGSIQVRAEQCLRNLQNIAEAGGTSLDRAIKVTVFLTNMADFQAVNQVYAQFFKEPYPARTAFQVAALPLGADIEIEAVFEC